MMWSPAHGLAIDLCTLHDKGGAGIGRDYPPRMHLDLRGNVSAAEGLNRGGVDRASADRAVFGE